MTHEIVEKVDEIATWQVVKLFTGFDDTHMERLRLSVGRIFQHWVQEQKEILEGKCKTKLSLYSGHDTTFIPMLLCLGAFDGKWPTFTSCVCVELREGVDGTPYVRVLYNFKEVILPGQKTALCTLKDFQELASHYIPKDFVSECEHLRTHAQNLFS